MLCWRGGKARQALPPARASALGALGLAPRALAWRLAPYLAMRARTAAAHGACGDEQAGGGGVGRLPALCLVRHPCGLVTCPPHPHPRMPPRPRVVPHESANLTTWPPARAKPRVCVERALLPLIVMRCARLLPWACFVTRRCTREAGGPTARTWLLGGGRCGQRWTRTCRPCSRL